MVSTRRARAPPGPKSPMPEKDAQHVPSDGRNSTTSTCPSCDQSINKASDAFVAEMASGCVQAFWTDGGYDKITKLVDVVVTRAVEEVFNEVKQRAGLKFGEAMKELSSQCHSQVHRSMDSPFFPTEPTHMSANLPPMPMDGEMFDCAATTCTAATPDQVANFPIPWESFSNGQQY